MSNVRSVARNFLALSIAQVISLGLSLVLVVLITRFIGDVGYGKLGFGMSVAAILTILAPLGLDQLMVRDVARDRSVAAKYLGNVLVLETLLSIPCFALIIPVVYIMRLPADSAAVLYISGGYYILSSLSGDMKNIFQAYEQMEYIAVLTSVKSVLTVALGVAVLAMGYGIVAVTWAYLAAGAIDLVLTLIVTLKRFVRPRIEIDFSFWKRVVPQALPFAMLALVTVTFLQVDVIILRAIKDDAAVGWYRPATVLATTFAIVPGILSSTIFPVMSRFHVSSKEALKFTMQKSAKYLLVLGFPIATGILLLAKPIITLFYGADFSPSIPALRILALYIPFSFLNAMLGTMLFSMDKQRLRLFCYLASTIARIALNVVLIYLLSLTGAAIAIVASEALLFGLNYYFSARHVPDLRLFNMMPKPLLASIGMAGLLFALHSINFPLVIIPAALVYFALFFALRGFDADDRVMLRNIWGKHEPD